MPLKVRRLPQARADRIDIWLHIAADSMGIADKVTDRLDDAVATLADYPELGPGRTDLGKGIRFFPVENWIILYRVEPGWIEIIRILHAARDIAPDLLAE